MSTTSLIKYGNLTTSIKQLKGLSQSRVFNFMHRYYVVVDFWSLGGATSL